LHRRGAEKFFGDLIARPSELIMMPGCCVAGRDALAAELAEVYPKVCEQLADLMARIAANNAVIERINRKGLPDGAKWLPGAELVARGMRGFSAGGLRLPSIVEQLRLPERSILRWS
jgi:hypothetical protein